MPTREKELVEYWSTRKELRKVLIKDIARKTDEEIGIDRDWKDVIFGWAIGKGLSINKAREFAEKSAYEIACAYPNKINMGYIYFMQDHAHKTKSIKR